MLSEIFIQENTFEDVISKMTVIVSDLDVSQTI